MFGQQDIDSVINTLKLSLTEKEDKVEIDTVEDFLNGVGHLAATCECCNIKLFDELGQIKIYESLASRLKMHGILIFTMQFPDGDKFEIVTRYNEAQQKIYSFGYKL